MATQSHKFMEGKYLFSFGTVSVKLTRNQFKVLALVQSKPGMSLTEILDDIADIYQEYPESSLVFRQIQTLETLGLIYSQLFQEKRKVRRYFPNI